MNKNEQEAYLKKQEQIVAQINAGREASMAAGALFPMIEKLESMSLNKLKSNYRKEDFTHEKMISNIAELVTLDNLKSGLERIIKLGTKREGEKP